MPVPTRYIEGEEYTAALKLEENGTASAYILAAIPFLPPNADGTDGTDYNNYKVIRILRLHVAEPRIYKAPNGGPVYVVLPKFDTLDYHYAQELHPVKGAWCYRYGPYEWLGTDHDDKLSDVEYLFPEHDLAPFELSNVLTH